MSLLIHSVDELTKSPEVSRIYEAELSQPLCTALQIALVRSLARNGIRPDSVIGHSSGEIAGGYAAGILSLEEAITIAYYRGFIMKEKSRMGAMAAIGLSSTDVAPFLIEGAVIAAENSPGSTTISGDALAVGKVMSAIREAHPDILCKKLKVDMAYHSHHMTLAAAKYYQYLQEELDDKNNTPQLAMYSTVSGGLRESPVNLSYWSTNLTSRVKFLSAAASMMTDLAGCVLLEIGAHSQLKAPLRQIASELKLSVNYLPTMIRGENSRINFLTSLGGLWQHGLPVNFASFPSGKVLHDLPAYPWDHSAHYWNESRVAKTWRNREYGHHALLGQRISEGSDIEPSWRVILDLEDEPWLGDHKIKGHIIFPFAGYIAMAGEAIRQLTGVVSGYSVRHIIAHSALLLHQGKATEMLTSLRPQKLTDSTESGFYHFTVVSYTGSSWIKHCEGLVKPNEGGHPTSIKYPSLPRKMSSQKFYTSLRRIGLLFGPAFKRLVNVEASTTEKRAVCEIGPSPGLREAPYHMHPTAMDACLQLAVAAMAKGSGKNIQQLAIPSFIEEINVFSSPSQDGAAARLLSTALACDNHRNTTIEATANGQVVFNLRGFKLSRLSDDQSDYFDRHAGCRLTWYPHVDFINAATLLKPPTVDPAARLIHEEFTLLCILDSAEIARSIEPQLEHLKMLKLWLQRSMREALEGRYPLLKNVSEILAIEPEKRAVAIKDRYNRLLETPCSSISKTVFRVHNNTERLFRGEVEAIQLLMEDGLLEEMYSSISFNFAPFAHALCISKPGLHILEIGAGTGGTTATILEGIVVRGAHPPYAKYTFTDVSAGFFPRAKERFRYAPNIEYKTLDVSANALDQGFRAETYDLIIASNAIHTLPSLNAALCNLRTLLRRGGHLLLMELCGIMQSPGYVFGNFSGWWLGKDDDREWQPYVPIERWDAELKAAGFTGVETAVLDSPAPLHLCAAILSQVPPAGHFGGLPRIAILHEDAEAQVTKRLVRDLTSRGHEIEMVKLGELPPSNAIVIATLDHESPFFEDISEGHLHTFQHLCQNYESGELLWLMPSTRIRCADPRSAQTIGAMGVFRNETTLPFFTLEIEADEPQLTDLVLQVLRSIIERDEGRQVTADNGFVVDRGVIKVGRLEPLSLKPISRQVDVASREIAKELEVGQVGLLSSLHWKLQILNPPGDDEVILEAKAIGLNFRARLPRKR